MDLIVYFWWYQIHRTICICRERFEDGVEILKCQKIALIFLLLAIFNSKVTDTLLCDYNVLYIFLFLISLNRVIKPI